MVRYILITAILVSFLLSCTSNREPGQVVGPSAPTNVTKATILPIDDDKPIKIAQALKINGRVANPDSFRLPIMTDPPITGKHPMGRSHAHLEYSSGTKFEVEYEWWPNYSRSQNWLRDKSRPEKYRSMYAVIEILSKDDLVLDKAEAYAENTDYVKVSFMQTASTAIYFPNCKVRYWAAGFGIINDANGASNAFIAGSLSVTHDYFEEGPLASLEHSFEFSK